MRKQHPFLLDELKEFPVKNKALFIHLNAEQLAGISRELKESLSEDESAHFNFSPLDNSSTTILNLLQHYFNQVSYSLTKVSAKADKEALRGEALLSALSDSSSRKAFFQKASLSDLGDLLHQVNALLVFIRIAYVFASELVSTKENNFRGALSTIKNRIIVYLISSLRAEIYQRLSTYMERYEWPESLSVDEFFKLLHLVSSKVDQQKAMQMDSLAWVRAGFLNVPETQESSVGSHLMITKHFSVNHEGLLGSAIPKHEKWWQRIVGFLKNIFFVNSYRRYQALRDEKLAFRVSIAMESARLLAEKITQVQGEGLSPLDQHKKVTSMIRSSSEVIEAELARLSNFRGKRAIKTWLGSLKGAQKTLLEQQRNALDQLQQALSADRAAFFGTNGSEGQLNYLLEQVNDCYQKLSELSFKGENHEALKKLKYKKHVLNYLSEIHLLKAKGSEEVFTLLSNVKRYLGHLLVRGESLENLAQQCLCYFAQKNPEYLQILFSHSVNSMEMDEVMFWGKALNHAALVEQQKMLVIKYMQRQFSLGNYAALLTEEAKAICPAALARSLPEIQQTISAECNGGRFNTLFSDLAAAEQLGQLVRYYGNHDNVASWSNTLELQCKQAFCRNLRLDSPELINFSRLNFPSSVDAYEAVKRDLNIWVTHQWNKKRHDFIERAFAKGNECLQHYHLRLLTLANEGNLLVRELLMQEALDSADTVLVHFGHQNRDALLAQLEYSVVHIRQRLTEEVTYDKAKEKAYIAYLIAIVNKSTAFSHEQQERCMQVALDLGELSRVVEGDLSQGQQAQLSKVLDFLSQIEGGLSGFSNQSITEQFETFIQVNQVLPVYAEPLTLLKNLLAGQALVLSIQREPLVQSMAKLTDMSVVRANDWIRRFLLARLHTIDLPNLATEFYAYAYVKAIHRTAAHAWLKDKLKEENNIAWLEEQLSQCLASLTAYHMGTDLTALDEQVTFLCDAVLQLKHLNAAQAAVLLNKLGAKLAAFHYDEMDAHLFPARLRLAELWEQVQATPSSEQVNRILTEYVQSAIERRAYQELLAQTCLDNEACQEKILNSEPVQTLLRRQIAESAQDVDFSNLLERYASLQTRTAFSDYRDAQLAQALCDELEQFHARANGQHFDTDFLAEFTAYIERLYHFLAETCPSAASVSVLEKIATVVPKKTANESGAPGEKMQDFMGKLGACLASPAIMQRHACQKLAAQLVGHQVEINMKQKLSVLASIFKRELQNISISRPSLIVYELRNLIAAKAKANSPDEQRVAAEMLNKALFLLADVVLQHYKDLKLPRLKAGEFDALKIKMTLLYQSIKTLQDELPRHHFNMLSHVTNMDEETNPGFYSTVFRNPYGWDSDLIFRMLIVIERQREQSSRDACATRAMVQSGFAASAQVRLPILGHPVSCTSR